MRFQVFLIFSFALTVASQYFNNAANTQPACLVTGNKLFSHGHYIRELLPNELEQIKQYKEELSSFQKKVADAFSTISFLSNVTNIPAMPKRPNLPSFCTSNETTLYVLGTCTVQNYKVYIGQKFARELNETEKTRLNEFTERLSNNQATSVPSSNSTDTELGSHKNVVLDFCYEF
ncbi:hypothetical protein M3Y97_00588700 [Aphelenchoides bicaudatus]|nr:hypothetical protein M3Y97_00588700 [Aphelenchoides bicaudatus]